MVALPSFPSFEWDFLVIDTPKGEELILGFDFFNNFNPSINLRQGLITFNSDNKDYDDPSNSFSNDFSSSKSCADLVDEVFKVIQEVGEDNSLSSLHLFFGNMDLPPRRSCGMERKRKKKVFPSAHHQYSNLFSKVKSEKIPPHCTCDHHIKLEGFLPPVEVIYSLPNQLSDKLRAYISDNVEKGSIWPSSSSKGEPVLFVKKKDGGLHLCVDY
ncbi:hypothetical protein O181_014890 [Austropuccinia psidii MF-1]|uniref:Reverse transcriptase domain-containing protein n=1 Tax=Austropuccinia psidii MF-1 TaxID=1389203 RepID=A0A9Q3C1T9_9BASI|nr:hypothetical protein [Austropuccinia psidii MF-1]